MLEKLWSMIKFAGIHPLKSVRLIYNIDTFSVSEQKFKYFHKIVWNIYIKYFQFSVINLV